MTNIGNNVLYTGITNDLLRRVYEHKNKLVKGFTSKYNITKLVYYEQASSAVSAITREKQIKAGSRTNKIKMIDTFNPVWEDLYEKLI
jgi:putative endonuclease